MLDGKPELRHATGSYGNILSVRGSVIDARFDRKLPLINNILRAGEQSLRP